MLHALTDHLHNTPAVTALATYGSTAEPNLGDQWSDIDAACGAYFDQLAKQWTNTYTPHAYHLTTHTECVHNYLEIVD